MEPLLESIDERYRALLLRIARGDDVPPGHSLRLEGLLEAAVLVGLSDEVSLDRRLELLHIDVIGCAPADTLGADWRQAMPFPALPLFMARAPVYPSTAD